MTLDNGLRWLDGQGKRFDNLTARNWLHPSRVSCDYVDRIFIIITLIIFIYI
jgi:hypothetical protein